MRLLAAAPRALTPLALVAAALALVVPSGALAQRSDLLLALLVLVTALGISASDLARLRDHVVAIALLSVLPMVALAALAWVIGRPFAPTSATVCSPSGSRARRWPASGWSPWPEPTPRSPSARSPAPWCWPRCSARWRSGCSPVTRATPGPGTCSAASRWW
ncbi:MAG: hypothetical protein ACR2GZ_01395 [Solirubrobacteraceae bacterium]